jgi:hypothetical protein
MKSSVGLGAACAFVSCFGVALAAAPSLGPSNFGEVLHLRPSTKVYVSGHKLMTVAAIRLRLKRLLAAHAKPRRLIAHRMQPAAVAASQHPMGRSRLLHGAAASSAFATSGNLRQNVLGSKPCSQRGPFLLKGSGTFTPGATVVLHGDCLGTSNGQVRMYGTFPSGFLALAVIDWHADSVVAALPADTRGVIDQPVQIEVRRSDGAVSRQVRASFIARRELVNVPAAYITVTRCEHQDLCDGTGAFHSATNTVSDYDEYHVLVSRNWGLHQLFFAVSYDSVQYAGGFETGPPQEATFRVKWTSTKQPSDGVLFSNDLYEAGYGITITAWAPVGVSGDPNL